MTIRPYVPDQDDETLVSIRNAAWVEAPDFVPETIEQFRIGRGSPNWRPEGYYIAEVGGEPVGTVNGYVDPYRVEPLGYLDGPGVLPEFRRRGIGTALAARALDYLCERGMERVRTSTGDWNEAGRAFLERHGFAPVRNFSLMRRPLANLPSGMGENTGMDTQLLGTRDEDVALITRLSNEAFREHFGHRDSTEEGFGYWMRHSKEMGYTIRRTVARLDGEPVGYLIHGFDPRENEQLGVKRGGLWSVGVLKQFRNRGVAKRLMLDGMRWLAEQGMEEVELGVDDENVTRARRLYERLGFKPVRCFLTYERALGESR